MPRDISSKPAFDRAAWVAKMEKLAPKRRAVRTRVKPSELRGTLGASRNFRLVIREGALRKVMVIITYKKTTSNVTNKYMVEPYSYRTKKLKIGRRKMFFAYDTHAIPNPDPSKSKSEKARSRRQSIKRFAMSNIRKAILSDKRFRPRWPVEIR